MDHSKDDELRDDVEKNRDSYEIADRCQRAAHQSRALGFVKNQIAQEWRSARAGILDAVTCTEHDRDQGLQYESETAGSEEARDDVPPKNGATVCRVHQTRLLQAPRESSCG